MRRLHVLGLVWLCGMGLAGPAVAQVCSDNRLALQILGSGGPVPSDRASSGYLVWRDGESVALIDAGGGVFLRFGQSGARVGDLKLVAISHLHPDHVADLAALLWLSGFRDEPLVASGPSGAPSFPAFDDFLARLTGNTGALPVIGSRSTTLDPTTVDASATATAVVYDADGLRVTARGVPHGDAPTLAYRVDVDGYSLVFGGDQTAADPAFVEFARGADVLVMHLALSTNAEADSPLATVHALPGVVGDVAEATGATVLLLSHIMQPRADDPGVGAFSGADNDTLSASFNAVRTRYRGQMAIAEDLQCLVLQE